MTTMINLNYTLIYPYLIYCKIVWGNLRHSSFSFDIAPKILRIITDQSYFAYADPLFLQTGILKIPDIHKYLKKKKINR